VTATGEVQPCEFLQFSFGNVAEDSFDVIFERMREACAEPRTGWLCAGQGLAVHAFMRKNGLAATPVPWPLTRDLLASGVFRQAGKPTPLYVRLGIYKP
jgi:hypothetical protein